MAADNFLWFPIAAASGTWVSGKATKPQGESKDDYFGKPAYNALEISSFSFGVSQAETAGSSTSGASAGKAKFEEFTIERNVDLASAPIFSACVGGAHYPTVCLAVRKAGGSPLLYLQYIFRQVFVTGISWSGGGGEEAFKETVKFKFGAMGIQYIQQNPDGTTGTKMSAPWSTITNTPTLEVPTLPGSVPDYDKGPS